MITAIAIEGFKTLEKVSLTLGNLNFLSGTNASGKSNFFDGLRVLQGIGYGLTIDEIFNGKPKTAYSDLWEAIRGGSSQANFVRRGDAPLNGKNREIRFSATLKYPNKSSEDIKYYISISADRGWVAREKLLIGNRPVFAAEILDTTACSGGLEVLYNGGDRRKFDRSRPVLHQLLGDGICSELDATYLKHCIRTLSNMQHLAPDPATLRNYSQHRAVKRMGDRGENFAALVKTIIADEGEKTAFRSWMEQLMPDDLNDICILEGALGEPLFAIADRGHHYPAPVLADGTLRFAAITAAFFQPDNPAILTLEDIETGIHPSKMRLLVELLANLSGHLPIQAIAITRSPQLLNWLGPEHYSTIFVCKRDEATGATRIVPLSEITQFLKIAPRHPLGDLLAEGWFEGGVI